MPLRQTSFDTRRGDAKGPDESGAHLLFPSKATVFGNDFDAIGGFFQAPTRSIKANRFYGFRRRTAARLRIDPREVLEHPAYLLSTGETGSCGADRHMHTSVSLPVIR